MQDLHLVGFTKDRRHLIFSTRKGAKSGSFLVPVDGDLVDAVDEVASYVADHGSAEAPDKPPADERPASRPRVESSLSVKEVQTRLRAGEAVDAIASDAGVDPDWVERFATPIRAEQRRVVERAMSAHLQRPRAGESAVSLRRAIAAAMAERKIHMTAEQFESSWKSHAETAERWVVQFTFPTRGKIRTLEWDYEIASGRLTTSDRFASQLGFRSADDLPSDNSTVDDASNTGGRRSGGLAIPGTTTASPTSPAGVTRHPSPPATPWRPMPPPTVSAVPPRPQPRPSAPPTPPAAPRAVAGEPPQTGRESPVESRSRDRSRPASGGSPALSPQPEVRSRPPSGSPPPARPQQPDRPREPRDRGREFVESHLPAGPAQRRPDAVSPAAPAPEASAPSRPGRSAPPPRLEVEPAPIAPMAPKAPAPQAHLHRDPAPSVAARRPAPVAPDAERTVDEGDAEIAPSLRVISTVEDSSVRLIPPPEVDDADEPEPQSDADETEPGAEDEALLEPGEDIDEDDGPDAEDADHDVAGIEDDVDEDDFEEDEIDEDDSDDEDVVVEDDLDGDADADDVEGADEPDDEGELEEADDRQTDTGDIEADDLDDDGLEVPEQPAAVADRDESSDDDDDSVGGDVEADAVDPRPRGRVRFATESDRRSKPAGQVQEAVLADDDQPGDEEAPGAAPAGDTIAWNADERDRLRLRPMGEEDLHPRRRDRERRPRRSEPIVAGRDDRPSDEPERPARDAKSESGPRHSSAQFKAGFAKVAGADDRTRAEPRAPEPQRESPPASEPTEEADQSEPKSGIAWPEVGAPRSEEPQARRRESSGKPRSSGKKTRRRRSRPLRAR